MIIISGIIIFVILGISVLLALNRRNGPDGKGDSPSATSRR